ncbi:unnamed protein product, partial [marine sediment metagenome]
LRCLLRQVNPEADEELTEKLAKMEEDIGVSITEDILSNLGDTWVLASAPSQGGFLTGTLLRVEIKDAEKLAAAIRKVEDFIKRRYGPSPQTRPASGPSLGPPSRHRISIETIRAGQTEIHYLFVSGGSPMPIAPAWAIHNDQLYLAGWPQVLVSAIEATGAASLMQEPMFRKTRARISGQPSAMVYTNTPKMLRLTYHWLLLGWSMGAGALSGELGVLVRPD